ncbi:hypothetical protein K1719_038023 [Acacia pycnantha]|nr:hypothetical protein K1719_038023 [Acacia pycnantha]
MASFRASFLFLSLTTLTVAAVVSGHNITDILAGFPEYSQFNSFLSQTKLADEINSRQTITVLVLNNGAFSSLTSGHPLSVVKKALSLHVLLDYYDGEKLHKVSNGTTLTTTLYQTTGNAPGNLGFVNITDLKGGKVGFGSAAPGSKLDSSYSKSVKQIPYNISVLEISAPIIAPGLLTAPPPSADVNITALIEKAGGKTFASLLVSSGVIKTYETAVENGLTIFAPSDEAFKARGVPDLNKLTNAEQGSINTLATNGAGKYEFSTTTAGDAVTLHTGVDSSRVASTVLDSTPLAIFTVDSVLLPTELFGKSPSPAPAPEPVSSPTPAPALAPKAKSPAPAAASPSAPIAGTPAGSPADTPSAAADHGAQEKAAGVHVEVSAVLAVFLVVISSIVLS